MLKRKNTSCLCFKTWLKSQKPSYHFNDSKWEGWHYIALKKSSALLRGITFKKMVIFIVWMVFIALEGKKHWIS